MVWGVNIHIRESGPYSTVPLETQLQQIKEIGLTHIRVDVYNGSDDTVLRLKTLDAAATAQDLKVTPVFVEPTASAATSEVAAKNWCYAEARKLAKAFPSMWFEAGNELNFKCIKPNVTGEVPRDFDTPAYKIVRGAIAGMYRGFKSASTQPVAVGTAGIQFGFLDRLKADGVPWDVTSWHMYVPSGTPTGDIQIGGAQFLSRLASFGKPLAVTEFNQQDGHLSPDPKTMLDMLAVFRSDSRVIASYLYELLDQPGLPNGEATYGLCDPSGVLNPFGTAVRCELRANEAS